MPWASTQTVSVHRVVLTLCCGPKEHHTEVDGDSQETHQHILIPTDPNSSGSKGTLTEDTSDFWEMKGRLWGSHHARPRLTIFAPGDLMPGGPELQLLGFLRETRFKEVTSSGLTQAPGLGTPTSVRVDD